MRKNSASETWRGLVALSVSRPVFITVLNLLLILVGMAAFLGVDVRELPDVDRPVVTVRANLDGASPETMDTEVTSLLESAVARVPGVKRVRASSEENNMRLRAEFDPGVDLNAAASDVREAVSRVQRNLPEGVEQLVVIKADSDAQAVLQLAAVSNRLSEQALVARLEKEVLPELLSIDGVAEVSISGDAQRALHVLIYPAKLAAYNLGLDEVIAVLQNTQLDVPAGSYQSEAQELLVRVRAPAYQPEQLAKLQINQQVRIEDIADVFYGPTDVESYSLLNGRHAIGLGVIRQAGSNTIDISTEVKRRLQRISEQTQDFELIVTADDAEFISGALTEVLKTLAFTISVVLVVIALFLGQLRATLVPAVTMPISLIGTLAGIWVLGFSVNLLTLLALVLATGLIVDDAIVVLENIMRTRSLGRQQMAAALLGTRQVLFAVIATTLTLVAVFLPIAFLPGQTGRLFREFGIVLSLAVCISSFVAVTLCPMLASRLPGLSQSTGWASWAMAPLKRLGEQLQRSYLRSLKFFMRHALVSTLCVIAISTLGVLGFSTLNQELVPTEDRGVLRIIATGPDGASLAYSDVQAREVEEILQPYQDAGLVRSIYSVVGRWDKNRAYIEASLEDWRTRSVSQLDLARQVSARAKDMPGAQIFIRQGSSLGGGGGGSGVELALLGDDYDKIASAAALLKEALLQELPSATDISIEYDTSQPELSFSIDRQRAKDLGVAIEDISRTLQVFVERYRVVDLSIDDQVVPLIVGPARAAARDTSDLLNLHVLNERRERVPLSALVSVEEAGVAAELDRHAQRRAIELQVNLSPGSSLSEAMTQVRVIANRTLPAGIGLLFLGEAADLREANYDVLVTFLIALTVVFLVLAAQFESVVSALIVMTTVPFGIGAAIVTLVATGQTLNLYSQIGLVMLVGLMTKNAILLVEFMDQRRDEGKGVQRAVLDGVKVRLRPLMMTVISTVAGSLPLVLASGPGFEARQSIGWVIFGGLGLSTLFTLYLAPTAYRFIAPYVPARSAAGTILERQLEGGPEQ